MGGKTMEATDSKVVLMGLETMLKECIHDIGVNHILNYPKATPKGISLADTLGDDLGFAIGECSLLLDILEINLRREVDDFSPEQTVGDILFNLGQTFD